MKEEMCDDVGGNTDSVAFSEREWSADGVGHFASISRVCEHFVLAVLFGHELHLLQNSIPRNSCTYRL